MLVLTLFVGWQEGHPACKNGGWWKWALVSLDVVVPSRMVCVSACVNLPLHHKSRSSLLAPAHPDGPGKRAVKRLWWGGFGQLVCKKFFLFIVNIISCSNYYSCASTKNFNCSSSHCCLRVRIVTHMAQWLQVDRDIVLWTLLVYC